MAVEPICGMMVLNDLGCLHLVMDTIERRPQTGDQGISLKQQLRDTLMEHKECVDKDGGEDVLEIRRWKWNASSRPRSTSSHGR